jgi:glycosyltransferase involved in cell wall biosynthesis
VVIISPVLPYDGMPHAGGVYLQHLHRVLAQFGADLTFLVHDFDPNHEARGQPGVPERSVLLGSSQRQSFLERLAMWAAWNLDPWLVKRNPTWPPLPLVAQLLFHPRARAALRSADVVDLQWPEYTRLLPLVRVLAPRARRIVTLHDVLSQRWARRAVASPEKSRVAARAARSAKRLERSVPRRADAIVVFSEKDRDLLPHPGRAPVEVIAPPLAPDEVPARVPDPGRPSVVFVSMLNRAENDDAARWLVQEIWPRVVERVPDASLRIVGVGASDELVSGCRAAKGVELTGFVPDLGAEYAAAAACVIPLRSGAGVKFKTIEALVAGVPTITTSVGAEGIAGPERFAALTDDPVELAEAVARTLRDPTDAEANARAVQEWARRRYSAAGFQRAVQRVYGSDRLSA